MTTLLSSSLEDSIKTLSGWDHPLAGPRVFKSQQHDEEEETLLGGLKQDI